MSVRYPVAVACIMLVTFLAGCSSQPSASTPTNAQTPNAIHASDQSFRDACDIMYQPISAMGDSLIDLTSDLVNNPPAAAASLELVTESLQDASDQVTNKDVYPLAVGVARASAALSGDVTAIAAHDKTADADTLVDETTGFQKSISDIVKACQ